MLTPRSTSSGRADALRPHITSSLASAKCSTPDQALCRYSSLAGITRSGRSAASGGRRGAVAITVIPDTATLQFRIGAAVHRLRDVNFAGSRERYAADKLIRKIEI